ncbi:MAG: lysine--tRNA ligase [Thermoleophilia bacterium]
MSTSADAPGGASPGDVDGGIDRLIADRRQKADELRAAGINPFPARFTGRGSIADARALGDGLEPGAGATGQVTIAGRLVARRGQGKTVFADVEDRSGTVQAWATLDRLGDDGLSLLAGAHLGDIIGVRGTVVRTRRGEISVAADSVEMLAKALRPPPDRHAGLTDPETRYRQRYLDLMASEDVRSQFVMRARAISGVRRFLDSRGFIEVETPALQPIYGGAAARPFVTHHNEQGRDLFLRIATELYLKRCIVGGLEKVYELGKDFRNEGVSFKHNPEFTMLETYEAYADYEDVAAMLEEMVSAAAVEATGGMKVPWKGGEIDLTPPWRRVRLTDALEETSGIDVLAHPDADSLRAAMRAAGLDAPDTAPWSKLVDGILSQSLEPTLIQPTILLDYPLELSPFAKRREDDPRLVERFEAFCAGMEIANAFSELNDPDDQRERFAMLQADRAAGDDEAQPADEDFLTALEHGMPPTGGLGLGIDRLVMLLTDRHSIREVILFPAMRN